MLKKIGIYSAFLIVGLLLGNIFFMPKTEITGVPSSVMSEKTGKWTCAMHPDVDGQERGSCPLCNMDLVFMDSQVDSELADSQFKMSDDAMALANVETTIVANSTAEVMSMSLSGTITTNKETDAVQTTLFDGRIDALYTNVVGENVRKGQQIGLVYSPELYSAQDKLLTSASYKQTHQKLYDAARYTLGLWKMTDVQIDVMLATGKPMMNFPLYADVTGTVVEVLAAEGNYYSKGDPLFKISDLNTVWAIFDAYESQLAFLRVGQEVEIGLLSFPNETIRAKISFIEPIINDIKRTVPIRVVIDNGKGLLKPGMLIEAEVKEIMFEEGLISIPKSAVLWTGRRSVVYTKPFEDQAIFEMTEVELGKQLNNTYQVLEGLELGDVIVTEGTFTIDAAAQLSGKKSMMTKDTVYHKIHNHEKMNEILKVIPK